MERDSTDGRTLTLRDGRILGYAEYGDPDEDHTGPLTKHIGEIMATLVEAVQFA
jgi:hypothetical protein